MEEVKQYRNTNLYISKYGNVFRYTDGKFVRASIIRLGRKKRYLATTYMEDGKQKHVYIHRVVAEIYIPNPDNLPQVNHIDGNPRNNMVDNLEWSSARDNILHAYRTGLASRYSRGLKCKRCGAPLGDNNKSGFCMACKKANRKDKTKFIRHDRTLKRLEGVVPMYLPSRQKQYVKMFVEGKTIREIAAECGVSKQCVWEAINNANSTYRRNKARGKTNKARSGLEKEGANEV